MGIHIKIISGFNVGREYEFASGESRITIGRAADADVRLHEDDRNCARGVHARLVDENGQWLVHADHDNGVVLAREGKTLVVERGTRYPIGRNARVTLGTNGPQLRLTVRGAAPQELAPTFKNDQQVSDMPVGELTQDLVDAAASVRPGMRRLLNIVALVFFVAVLIGGAAFIRSESARRGAAKLEAALRSELDAQRADTHSSFSALKGAVTELDERTKQNLIAVLRRVEPSVVMLAMADDKGEVRFVGTGWVAGEKLIATNAHVAEVLRDETGKDGMSAVARRVVDGAVQNIPVIDIEIHPGYPQWSQIFADPTVHLRSGAGGGVSTDTLIVPYDVALVRTSIDCGPPLRIASSEKLRTLKAGDEVGYVGYPAENVFDPRSSPPSMITGRITRLTDYFYNPVVSETALLIHHNLPTVGGASGSPLLDTSGEVIAINSAGNFVGAMASTEATRPTRVPVGFNYAESVEFVRECVQRTAPQALRERNSAWSEKLQQFSMPPEQLMDALATRILKGLQERGSISAAAKLARELEQRIAIRSGLGDGAVAAVELPAGATVIVQACADDRSDLDLEVAEDEQFTKIIAKDSAENSFPQAGFVATRRGKYWIRVYAPQTILDNPTIRLRVSRLVS